MYITFHCVLYCVLSQRVFYYWVWAELLCDKPDMIIKHYIVKVCDGLFWCWSFDTDNPMLAIKDVDCISSMIYKPKPWNCLWKTLKPHPICDCVLPGTYLWNSVFTAINKLSRNIKPRYYRSAPAAKSM